MDEREFLTKVSQLLSDSEVARIEAEGGTVPMDRRISSLRPAKARAWDASEGHQGSMATMTDAELAREAEMHRQAAAKIERFREKRTGS